MKNILSLLAVIFSATALAQSDKTLVYCDHDAPTAEEKIFLDLYFQHYQELFGVYIGLEIGVLESETDAYPDYLYTVTYPADTSNATSLPVAVAKNSNHLNFSLPAKTSLNVHSGVATGFVLSKTNGIVDDFELLVSGTYKGQGLQNVKFVCYDAFEKGPNLR